MINQWRKGWGQDQLYFFWAQLAHWKEPVEEPIEKDEHGWAEICFQQFEVLDQVPDSGMAVLNDIGHNRSIHPPNKMDVGKRLSLWALQAEGKNVIPSGPLYQSARKDGNNVIITFKYAGSGLMTGSKTDLDPTVETQEPLGHFQICGADRQWKWAEAKITGKDTVEVRHPEIANPVEVRYAWAANPAAANLYNKEGLPASVFKAEL
jgi:sialate O-acetylesterase